MRAVRWARSSPSISTRGAGAGAAELLDLCAITDTLIADADGVDHPADFNDRFVLGLRRYLWNCERSPSRLADHVNADLEVARP